MSSRVPSWAILLACCATLLCRSGLQAADQPKNPDSTNAYMRVGTPDTNTFQLEIAVRKLRPLKPGQPELLLAGVSHLGETNYYQALQQRLNAQSLVLYEGVRHADADTAENAPAQEQSASGRKMKADEDSIQFNLARSLGLAFQLSIIDYEQPNFRNSDMSIDQIARILSGGRKPGTNDPPAGARGSAEFQILMQVMDGTSFIGRLANGIVRMLGANPRMQASTRLMLIELLGSLQGDLTEMGAIPPDMKRLLSVLLHARNGVVVADLRKELQRAEPPKSMAVFYGAAHMSDLERRICEELGYRTGDTEWLPAIRVNLKESGLTSADVNMARGLVKWQMQMLQQTRPQSNPQPTQP